MSNPATNIDKWPVLHPGHCIPGGTYSTPNGKEDRCTTEPVWTREKRKISCSCYKWTSNTLVMQTATYQLHNWAVPEHMGQNEKPASENLLISKKGVLIQIMNDKCPITITIKHTIFMLLWDKCFILNQECQLLLHAEQFSTHMCTFYKKQNSMNLKTYENVKTTLQVHRCSNMDAFNFNTTSQISCNTQTMDHFF
jgi:hypothetical protein